jgi:hypothetical protein
MSSQITRKLFTIDDCYKMAEVGILSPDERTELINGEILVVPPPGPRSSFVVNSLNEAFVKLAQGKAVVRVQGASCCTGLLHQCRISSVGNEKFWVFGPILRVLYNTKHRCYCRRVHYAVDSHRTHTS